MKFKNSLTKQREKISRGITIGIFVSLLMFLFLSRGYAAVGLNCNFPEVALSDIKIGSFTKMEDVLKVKLKYTNTGTESNSIEVSPYYTGFTPESGYSLLSEDCPWVEVSPSTFTLAAGGFQEVSVNIEVPTDVGLLADKYHFRIWGRTTTGASRAGSNTQVLLSLSSQYIGYGVTGYESLSPIGMIGNKAIVKTNIASLVSNTVKLYYRVTGATTYTGIDPIAAKTITNTNGTQTYCFEIPASVITTAGFQYYIQSIAGTDYAFAPEPATAGSKTFDGTPYDVLVSRTTTGRISTSGSTITVFDGNTDDGAIKITAPRSAVASDLSISLEQIDENSSDCPAAPNFSLSEKPAMIFKFTPSGAVFAKNIDLTLLYLDLDSNGIVDGLIDRDGNVNINASTLKMFYWDGFKWRLLSGSNAPNTTDHTVTCKVNHFSYYALFPVTSLAPEDYRPAKKIITPNGDGVNDDADFSGLAEEIKIFDITGKKIRTISAGTGLWDGKDDDGSIVESGVYIYQFKVDGTLVSGAIAVAK